MAYCFNAANGYNQIICDEFDDGESTPKRRYFGRPRKSWQSVSRWISAKKAYLCRDFGMNDEGSLIWGCCRGLSWRSVFWKIRAELRRMIKSRPASHMTFKYDALSYSLNFDDGGNYQHDPDYV